jgi:hypothetical protein
VRVLLSLKDHPTIDLYNLFERLNKAGVYPTGGADLGDLEHAILFRRPKDTDQAIALLKRMGSTLSAVRLRKDDTYLDQDSADSKKLSVPDGI